MKLVALMLLVYSIVSVPLVIYFYS